jgi:hypothetical protein
MADPRKLPVLPRIYVAAADKAYWEPRASLETAEEAAKEIGSVVTVYEPAVPRCRTCNQVTRVIANRTEYRCAQGLPIMQDGSGYCWLHPEARRD